MAADFRLVTFDAEKPAKGHQGIMPKSGYRFSEIVMLKKLETVTV